MWSDCPWSLELSHCFPCRLHFSLNVAGAIRPLRRRDTLLLGAACPLLRLGPYCPGTAFPALPGSRVGGRAAGHTGLIILKVSKPARFTRWSKISYLFRFFSPCGWIEACVRVSVALCHIVSSGGWRRSWRTSPLQHYARWLPLYPYSVFQVLDDDALVSLVAAGNK